MSSQFLSIFNVFEPQSEAVVCNQCSGSFASAHGAMMSSQNMFLLFLEKICMQQVNIADHVNHPLANQSRGRQTQWGEAQWCPEYTCTDKDNTGLGTDLT